MVRRLFTSIILITITIWLGCKKGGKVTQPNPTPEQRAATPTPTPGATSTVKVAVIGDFGIESPNTASVAQLVRSWNPGIVVTVGDNNYPKGAADTIDNHVGQYYSEYIHPYKGRFGSGSNSNRFFPALGNHDWETARAAAHLDYFQLPGNERYYDFVYGPIHFFCLDSDSHEPDGTSPDSAQGQWLQNKLKTSTTKYQVVYFHHPPFSSSTNGSHRNMQWPFASWGVDLVMSGHDHTYERVQKDNLNYVVNGLGGYEKYPFKSLVPGSVARYSETNGAMLIEASPALMTVKFISITNVVADQFTISP